MEKEKIGLEKIMNKLLRYRYMDDEKNNIGWLILVLLDELRIATTEQLIELIEISCGKGKKSSVYYKIKYLIERNMIEYTFVDNKNSSRCYYLTRLGNQSIGSLYPVPRVPIHDMYRQLIVNDVLIKTIKETQSLQELEVIVSKRREEYELTDNLTEGQKKILPILDYKLQFKESEGKRYQWIFDVEISLKSRRRYLNNVFPRYIKLLNEDKKSKVIFITLSPLIKKELETFKNYFKLQKSEGEYRNINADVFDRIYIFSEKNFEVELKNMFVKEDI